MTHEIYRTKFQIITADQLEDKVKERMSGVKDQDFNPGLLWGGNYYSVNFSLSERSLVVLDSINYNKNDHFNYFPDQLLALRKAESQRSSDWRAKDLINDVLNKMPPATIIGKSLVFFPKDRSRYDEYETRILIYSLPLLNQVLQSNVSYKTELIAHFPEKWPEHTKVIKALVDRIKEVEAEELKKNYSPFRDI